jgi:hypothetical protein
MASIDGLLDSAGRRCWWVVCLALAACAPRPAPDALPAAPAATTLTAPRRVGFEVNRGQWPAPVRYAARDGEATLFLTEREAVWRLHGGGGGGDYVRLRWIGANADAELLPSGERPVRLNYLHGRDASRWHSGVPVFEQVTYRQVYPDIDLVFHDARGALEYDFVVAPGADPAAIRLRAEGARAALIDAGGRLVLRLDGGDVVQKPPLAFQDTAAGRQVVAAHYRLVGGGGDADSVDIAFALGPYDRALPVIIDPSVGYLTEVDDQTDSVVDIAADAQGNLWMVGTTPNADFPVTDDAIESVKSTSDDGYVVKLDAQGELVYATYLGGSFFACMGGVDVDAAGNAYLTGATLSEDFPVTEDALQPATAGGQGDAFLTKLGPDGELLYSTYFGGTSQESGCNGGRLARSARVRVTADGAIFLLIGSTISQSLPGSAGARPGLDSDAYLARLTADLMPEWGRFIGGSATDMAYELAIDGEDNAYVYGTTSRIFGMERDFPATAGAFQEDNDLDTSHFIAKFSPAGALAAATLFGPTSGADNSIEPGGLAVGDDGTAYLVVTTGSTLMPVTAGALQPALSGFSDLFVAVIDASLSTVRHATYLGGSAAEHFTGGGLIADLDDAGDLYVGGETQSSDYPLRDPLPNVASDVVLSKFSPDLGELLFSTRVPVGTFALDARDGAVYVGGQFPNRLACGAVKIVESAAPACRGDCDGDGVVRVNELIIGVRIALGQDAIGACANIDGNGDGSVAIAELIGAVGASLQGCA